MRFLDTLWPKTKQCKRWTLPSKYTTIGCLIGAVGLPLAILIALVLWRWPYAPKDQDEPVLISPTTITLAEKGYRNITLVHVRNRTDQYVYDVLTKLTIHSDCLSFSNLWFSIPSDEKDEAEYIAMPTNDNFTVAVISKTSLAVYGRDPNGGAPVMYVLQDHLPPRKGYSIKVEIPPHVNISTSQHILVCSYVSSTSIPTPVRRGSDPSVLFFWGPRFPPMVIEGFHSLWTARSAESEAGKAFNQGVTNFITGQIDEAIRHYSRAIAQNPGMHEAYFNRAAAYLQKGETAKAIADYRAVTNLAPSLPSSAFAHYNLGTFSRNEGNLPDAIQNFQESCRLNPEHAESHFYLAVALGESGGAPTMEEHLEKALRLKPSLRTVDNDAAISFFEGVSDLKSGRSDAAIEHFSQNIARSPSNYIAYHNRAYAYGQKGETEKALADYRVATTLAPSYSFEPYFNLGMFNFNHGDMKPAISNFQVSCKLQPEHAESHFYLGVALGRSGDLPASAPHLETALKLKPSLAALLNLPVETNKLAQPSTAPLPRAPQTGHSEGER